MKREKEKVRQKTKEKERVRQKTKEKEKIRQKTKEEEKQREKAIRGGQRQDNNEKWASSQRWLDQVRK